MTDPDGSVDVWFGPTLPSGVDRANRSQTVPEKGGNVSSGSTVLFSRGSTRLGASVSSKKRSGFRPKTCHKQVEKPVADPRNYRLEHAMKIRSLATGFIVVLTLTATVTLGNALPLLDPGASFKDAVSSKAEPVAARRTVAVRGPRGGAARRTTVVRPGVRPVHPIARPGVRPGVRPVHPIARPGRWVRPPYYTWRPGGAIAAGAALGFVAASAAVVYAGAPPAPGYCWYYTDPSRTQGFWDVCP